RPASVVVCCAYVLMLLDRIPLAVTVKARVVTTFVTLPAICPLYVSRGASAEKWARVNSTVAMPTATTIIVSKEKRASGTRTFMTHLLLRWPGLSVTGGAALVRAQTTY